MMNKLRSKKGFTLVELCVVIAIMGIVVSMVVIFMGQYSKDTYSLMRNRTAMKDINEVRRITNEWLRYYDNGHYSIAPSDAEYGSAVLQAKRTGGAVDSLEINNGKIVWKKNGAVFKQAEFDSITKATFTFSVANKDGSKPIIKCRVHFNKNKNWQDLFFSVMTKTPRSRYSPAEA